MKKLISNLLLLIAVQGWAGNEPTSSPVWSRWAKPISQRLQQIWVEGNNELYLSGYAWHNRSIYSREKIALYNELAWGGGLGRGLFDEKGNWHGLYTLAFLDSHHNIEPAAGYAYLKIIHFPYAWKAGIGYTLLVTVRPELNKGLPFPGALPWTSIFYRQFALAATYIPGFNHNGNVAYLLGKYTF